MGIRTVKYFSCDRCGIESEHNGFNKLLTNGCGEENGSLLIKYSGHRGSTDAMGCGAGKNIKDEKFICFSCLDLFLKFLDGG